MADISRLTLLDNSVYDIKDSAARQLINDIGTVLVSKADIDENGKVPISQLPSYVDDVIEYASISNFPSTGETGKIYVALDTNLTYRWSGSGYTEISPSLALGETSSTAYRGDRGKTAYDHAAAKGHAYSSGLYKITTNGEGHVVSVSNVIKADITALGIPGEDTTYSIATTSTSGLMSATDKLKLDGIASGATANEGTITGITMNGASQGTSGVVNLGTVITSHQDISHLAPKASPVFTSSISLGRLANSTVGLYSIAVGADVTASEIGTQAFGWHSIASGFGSFANGSNCTASGRYSSAGGVYTEASAECAFAAGRYTTANHPSQYTFGQYSVADADETSKGTFVEIIGNGASESNRSNARTLDWNGNQRLKGTLYVNADADGTGGTQVLARGVTWAELQGT